MKFFEKVSAGATLISADENSQKLKPVILALCTSCISGKKLSPEARNYLEDQPEIEVSENLFSQPRPIVELSTLETDYLHRLTRSPITPAHYEQIVGMDELLSNTAAPDQPVALGM